MNEGDRRRRLASLQDVSESLREPIETPDLTAQILERVDTQRAFMTKQTRRKLWITRASVGVCVIALAGTVATVVRLAPGTIVPAGPAPLTEVVTTAESRTASGFASLRETIESVETPETPQQLVKLVLGAESPAESSPIVTVCETHPTAGRTHAPIAVSYSPDPRLGGLPWTADSLRSLVAGEMPSGFSGSLSLPSGNGLNTRLHALPSLPSSGVAPLLPAGSGGPIPR